MARLWYLDSRGKCLSRTFLRHLHRTQSLVHVVDTSADDPVQHYRTLREEFCIGNPDKLERSHMEVLKKFDFLEEKREVQ